MPKVNFPIPPMRNGIVREAAVDETLIPEDSVEFAMNVHFDRIGAVERRKGITLLGAQVEAGASVLGMGAYRNNAGSNYKALAKVDTNVYSYNGTSWSSVRGSLTAASKADFTNFVDYTFMVNGNGNEACSTYNGSGSFGSTNVASLPAGDFIENYRSRIWVADNSDDRLYYSDVVTTSNTITGGTSFLQISPADGERITGLARHSRALLVFKQNHIYRVFSVNSTDPDPSIFRGTYSNASIIEGKDGISYHHPSGFYNFVFDGNQQEISRPIIDIVQAIPRSSYESIVGWDDDDHKYWSIGDITLGGVTFNNVVVCRTISTEVWTVYSYAQEITGTTLYDDGTNVTRLVGDTDGNVFQFNTGNDDAGTPVFYDLTTHWFYFTELKTTAKTINEIAILHEDAHGGNISYQTDSDSPNKWRPIGDIERDIYQIMSVNANKFNRIRFRLSGNSSGTPFIFRGWEVLSMITDGAIKH